MDIVKGERVIFEFKSQITQEEKIKNFQELCGIDMGDFTETDPCIYEPTSAYGQDNIEVLSREVTVDELINIDNDFDEPCPFLLIKTNLEAHSDSFGVFAYERDVEGGKAEGEAIEIIATNLNGDYLCKIEDIYYSFFVKYKKDSSFSPDNEFLKVQLLLNEFETIEDDVLILSENEGGN